MVFFELCSKETVCFWELILSAESIFMKVRNTIPRMHESRVEEVTQLVAFSLVFLSIILFKGLITQVHVCF